MNEAVVFLEPKGTILEVIRSAKERGYKVVALSSDETLLAQAPEPYRTAVTLIDSVIEVSGWQDEKGIFDACAEIHAQTPIAGVYAGLDPCALILAKLRTKYGLPTHDPAAIEIVLDKFQLRRKLFELGLSQIRNFKGAEVDEWNTFKTSGAAYFKPVHGFFSAYVRRCENMQDLVNAQAEWNKEDSNDPAYVRNYVRLSNEYHLEEAFDGELLSVEALVTHGKFQVLGLLSRILYSKNPVVEMGSCFPYPHQHREKIIALVEKAHQALCLTDGPTHTEVIVNEKGEIEIIDLNPRFVGADVLQSINYAYEIKAQEILLDYAIGENPIIDFRESHYSCLQYFFPPEVACLQSVAFPEGAEVKFHSQFIKNGSQLSTVNRQIDYLGCYLTAMPGFQEAISRSRELRSRVRINGDQNGVF
jgi:biotin carboxylase